MTKRKIVIINAKAKILGGALKGIEGDVVGYDSEINVVWISLDVDTTVLVKAELIQQN